MKDIEKIANLMGNMQDELMLLIKDKEILSRIAAYLINMRAIHNIPPDVSIRALLELGHRYEVELIRRALELAKELKKEKENE